MSPATPPAPLLRRSVLIVLALALVGGSIPAGAQTERIEAAKAERQAKAAEVADTAAGLDPLLAEDAELEAAAAALGLYVATKQAKLDATRQALAAARDHAVAATDDVATMNAAIDTLKAAVRARVVEAYVSPDSERVDTVLTNEDITVAALKRALLETISGNETDLLDQLKGAEARLVDLEAAAASALDAVVDKQAEEISQLDEVQEALDEQERLREALQARIDEVHAEIAALEAQETVLTSLITNLIDQEDARQRAFDEARRRAEEAARRAAHGEDQPPGSELPPPPSSSGLIWPTSGVVSSWFGPRWGRQHQGIDIAANTGTAVVAVQSGSVLNAGVLSGYGNIVIINHGDGFTSVYAHLNSIAVSPGQSISRGQQIGAVGCSGSCTGPHLHFETRVWSVPQDPMLYL